MVVFLCEAVCLWLYFYMRRLVYGCVCFFRITDGEHILFTIYL